MRRGTNHRRIAREGGPRHGSSAGGARRARECSYPGKKGATIVFGVSVWKFGSLHGEKLL
jgi:hypothetical protein